MSRSEIRIWEFITAQTVLNLATSVDDSPYCCSCFYVLDESQKMLVFKSGEGTRHEKDIERQPEVAGTILPDLSSLGTIKGIQFMGNIVDPTENERDAMIGSYYRKYPYARAMKGNFRFIGLTFVKMTDNTLGIGKKIIWDKTEVDAA